MSAARRDSGASDPSDQVRTSDIEEASDAYDDVRTVEATIGGGLGPLYQVRVDLVAGEVIWGGQGFGIREPTSITRQLSPADVDAFRDELRAADPLHWEDRYLEPGVVDGTVWGLTITSTSGTSDHGGSNAFPGSWERFRELIEQTAGQPFR